MRLLNRLRPNRLCLNMIVKNEAHTIKRGLLSAIPLIDTWCIVDTGSSDGTQGIIKEVMAGIPGKLVQSEWLEGGFAANRNHAWEQALEMEPTHLLFIDADETFFGSVMPDYGMLDLGVVDVIHQGRPGPRIGLARASLANRWKGRVHEDIPAEGRTIGRIESPWIMSYGDGARSKTPQERTDNDLRALFADIQDDPTNPRGYYYLGMVYFKAGDLVQAEQAFRIRIGMGGCPIELVRAQEALGFIQTTLRR